MEDMQPTEGPLGSRDDENYPELTIDAEEGGSETGSTATASDEPPLAEGVSQQELPSKPSLDLDAIIGASKVSFDENGNLVVESASKGANSAGSESNDEDEDDGLDTPKVRQPLLSGADSPTGRLEKADVEFSSLSGDNTLRSHSRPSGRFNINDQFPLTVKNPSAADIIFLLLFAAATSTFFTSAVVASDVTGDPTCRDLDWDSAIQPYLTANDLDFKDCTEMVHVLSCEYMLKAEPGGETSASDESQQHRLAMHQVLNLCGGSCQVCGVTWLGKDDSGIGRWALFVCSALSPLLGLAWSRVYLSARNRADMLQVRCFDLAFEFLSVECRSYSAFMYLLTSVRAVSAGATVCLSRFTVGGTSRRRGRPRCICAVVGERLREFLVDVIRSISSCMPCGRTVGGNCGH